MNIKEAKEQIKHAVTAYLTRDALGQYVIPPQKQRPVFLMGPPGIGKTAIMEQIASELGLGLLSYSMTHHTRQSALGLPVIKHVEFDGREYDISEYTMSEIIASVYELMRDTGVQNGILFLDEINCVSETLTPVMLQFLQYKTFGRHQVPPGWIVVTAGNPPEYNRSVREFDIATWDRLKRVDVEPDFTVWKKYAYASGVHLAVMTYLEIKQHNFYKVETTVDGKSFVTARGWDDLAQMISLYEQHGIPVTLELIGQYLQNREIAADFALYYDLYNKYRSDYQVESILAGTPSEEIKARAHAAKFDERYSLIGLLLEQVMGNIDTCMAEDEMLTELMAVLREFKAQSAAVPGQSADFLNNLKNQVEKRLAKGKESHSLSDAKQSQLLQVVQILMQGISQGGQFEQVKADFDRRVKEHYTNVKAASDQVSYMFRFCDEVFPNGQELIILVTELTTNPHTAQFLAKYRVEEYFIHDKALMFSQRQKEIRTQIEELKL